jgi:hypothetical protein
MGPLADESRTGRTDRRLGAQFGAPIPFLADVTRAQRTIERCAATQEPGQPGWCTNSSIIVIVRKPSEM